ncbi:potassium channel protein [Candidatus Venteria ishoeyi]|uniref:Voltage-gated potassium channel n=1 Tax=Candidatus Venteria ishoeyi TaxID=1899563 RepID=A0A1H6FG68_9GAMM|nr:potassium channel family protein [Candidatus Venteria ishoeyi]MDM8545679.1 ion channel [Candidatus Venteria ishoeyi]SEH09062.1 voltage-gated potassium channel [Candidatus Venteria ishoeyi]
MFLFKVFLKNYKAIKLVRENKTIVLIFLGFSVLFAIYMMAFEGLNLIDSYYFLVTTATTVGYGDISPKSDVGKLLVTIYMVIGIALLGLFLGKITDLMVDISSKRKKGLIKMKTRVDLIIAGYPGDEKVSNIITELRNDERYKKATIVCVNRLIEEKSPWMNALDVDYVHGVASDISILEAAGIKNAKTVLILANDPGSIESDDLNTSICAVISRINPTVRTIIEKVRQDDMLFKIANADTIVDIAPASVLAQEILDPGAIELQNAIFSTDTQGTQFNFTYEGEEIRWSDLALSILKRDAIPEGFKNPGAVNFNLLPRQEDKVQSQALVKYRGIELIKDML